MTHHLKTLGVLLARAAAVLVAVSALVWFVVRAQRNAADQLPTASPATQPQAVTAPAAAAAPASAAAGAATPVAAVGICETADPPAAYLSTSKSLVLTLVASRPAKQTSPLYMPSSKLGHVRLQSLPEKQPP